MLKREGLDTAILEKLTIYVVLSTIIGARLGHCLFYEFSYYIKHPLEMILPWKGTIGKDFRFTGYQGLASHGAAIGILIGIFLFSRKTKLSYLWTLDRLAIVVALAAVMIRTGNLMNSEVYGKRTENNSGFLFVHDLSGYILANENIKKVTYQKSDSVISTADHSVPVDMEVVFQKKVKNENVVKDFIDNRLKKLLNKDLYNIDYYYPDPDNLKYTVIKQDRTFVIKAQVFGFPRIPSQIVEASAYLVVFLLLFWIYYKKGKGIKDGFYIGLFMVLIFISRFFIEFIKEDQESFEHGMALNMGQILSIPLVIAGLILAYLKRPVSSNK